MYKKVFLIEDDFSIRSDLTELLSMEGYEVQAFPHGKAGLEALRAATVLPQLILLDLMMPVMNGYEFLDHFAKEARICEIPVLVLSADRQVESLLRQSKVKKILKKPVDLDHLLQTVAECAAAS